MTNNFELYIWKDCTDETYWPDDDSDYTAIVQYGGCIYTRQNCWPGWNILMNNGGKIMYIEKYKE